MKPKLPQPPAPPSPPTLGTAFKPGGTSMATLSPSSILGGTFNAGTQGGSTGYGKTALGG
jgi:hypothetical protein